MPGSVYGWCIFAKNVYTASYSTISNKHILYQLLVGSNSPKQGAKDRLTADDLAVAGKSIPM